jgi:amino acid transporter
MTLRRLSVLQWFGFLAGGTIWWATFLTGIGTTVAVCNPASARWGIAHDTVQLALTSVALVFILAAQAAAVTVFRATRNVEEADPPPEGRLHFFSIGALLGNTLFLVIILLTEIASVVDRACHQA